MIVRDIKGITMICVAMLFKRDQERGVYPREKALPRCDAIASYYVDNQPYCRRHAMAVVFERVLEANR